MLSILPIVLIKLIESSHDELIEFKIISFTFKFIRDKHPVRPLSFIGNPTILFDLFSCSSNPLKLMIVFLSSPLII